MSPAAAHPLDDTQPYDELVPERVLAVQVLKQAAEDLHFATRRDDAARFLLDGFWASWWRDLLPSLSLAVVQLYVHAVRAQAPRKVDVERPAPAPVRAVVTILKTWRTPHGNRRQLAQLTCGHVRPMYAGPHATACRQCLLTPTAMR